MKPTRMKLEEELLFGFGILASQIKLNTRKGLTDLAKAQEKSLLELINIVYAMNFKDMNVLKTNYPAIDYGDITERTALQMTATVTKAKFNKTIDKIKRNEDLRKSYQVIWFFLLIVEAVPEKEKITSEDIDIEYLSFHEITNLVLDSTIENQKKIIMLLKNEYPDYFNFNKKDYRINKKKPVPKNLKIFNEFIKTIEWFTENPDEGYSEVQSLLESFSDRLFLCSKKSRNILLTIMEIKGTPESLDGVIEIYEDELMGIFDIDCKEDYKEYKDLLYHLDFLEKNELIKKYRHLQGTHIDGDDVIIDYRTNFILKFHSWDLAINLFSVLPSFYEKYYSYFDFEYAIENVDFSKLF